MKCCGKRTKFMGHGKTYLKHENSKMSFLLKAYESLIPISQRKNFSGGVICSTSVHYQSPVGAILIAADDIGLTGLWFEGQKYFALHLDAEHEEKEIPLFGTVKRWPGHLFFRKRAGFYSSASLYRYRFSERKCGKFFFPFHMAKP